MLKDAPRYSPGICRSPVYLVLSGGACLGHMYPLFFHFRGGKGVATALGTMLPIALPWGAVITTWLLVLLVSGYSSLASIVTVLLTPLFTYLLKPNTRCRSPCSPVSS